MATFFSGIVLGRHSTKFLPLLERSRPFQRSIKPNFKHGAIGIIQSLKDNTFILEDRSGTTKIIMVDNQTKIQQGSNVLKFSDLRPGQHVIVLGNPQDEEQTVKAELIRVVEDLQNQATQSGVLYRFHGKLTSRN